MPMSIALNSKKTIIISSIGLCILGTVYAAFKIFYSTTRKQHHSILLNKRSSNAAKTKIKQNNSKKSKADRPNSLNYSVAAKPNGKSTTRRERELLMATSASEDVKNLPAEELLELGLNYLDQAVKSWETALDSIESSAYMQSQTLALPTDNHADIVYKLRNLVESGNRITLNLDKKAIKSSQTLQIIQSRLAYKQQMYTEALLRNMKADDENNKKNSKNNETTTASTSVVRFNVDVAASPTYLSPIGSFPNKYGYTNGDDEDTESFVSADSDVDWLSEEMLRNVINVNETNVLYEMALSNASLGRIGFRIDRFELLCCKSTQDFAAKLHVIRLGFDRLLQDSDKRTWFAEEGKQLAESLFRTAEKDCTGFNKAYDEIVRFCSVEGNWKAIKDELATRGVMYMNFYDVALDFILLDAFEDLDAPPSAIVTVIQNRWLSQSFKETALATAVWSVLKTKRKMLKYPDGFINRFYMISEYLVPVLCWGFLGTDEKLNKSCQYLKSQVVEYLKCLFDAERTRYTNLDEVAQDIEVHSIKYLREMIENL